MSKKVRSKYVCQSCGHEAPKWMGKCPECNNWNTYVEEVVESRKTGIKPPAGSTKRPVPLTQISGPQEERMKTGISELDRVLGGGIVPGSVILIGGAPGMGKSTLLLQAGYALAKQGRKVLYISGEESPHQIKMRADRLSIDSEHILLATETNAERIQWLMQEEKPDFMVVDSVQTVESQTLEGLPGNISQVRTCGYLLGGAAKEAHVPLFLIGHVTKDGNIAGPRVLEHLVDGLLLLEGDHQHLYRLLRAVKNRFGSTNEVGIFEMTDQGMEEVENPSAHLISQRQENTSGTAVTVSLEGTRPLLVEVQALVAPTSYGVPQRTTTGVDHRRLSMLLAVLEKRAGLRFGTMDVFVNAAGGMRLTEPGVDLGLAMAIVSSLKEKSIHNTTALVGEVGLAGEIRAVSQMDKRVSEVSRLGFKRLVLPQANLDGLHSKPGIELVGVKRIREAVDILSE